MTKTFRTFVVLALLLHVALFFLVDQWPKLYDEPTLRALSWNQYGAWFVAGKSFYAFLFMVNVAVYCGLLLFNNQARYALVLLVLFTVSTSPFRGLMVSSGIESSLGYALSVLEGAIIAMAFTALRPRFTNGTA